MILCKILTLRRFRIGSLRKMLHLWLSTTTVSLWAESFGSIGAQPFLAASRATCLSQLGLT